MRGRVLLATALTCLPMAQPAPAYADEPICVGVVVDYRDLAGAPSRTSAYCAKVPNRSTGFEILVARARALGRPAPRSESGLLCAIDGLPERGCGESAGDGYRYWAYFHRAGDGSWQYSNRGAADYRVIDDPARSDDNEPGEGWVWVDGGAEGSVRPAAIPYDEICPPAAKATPTPRRTAASPAAAATRTASTAPSGRPGHVRSAAPATSAATSAEPAAPAGSASRASAASTGSSEPGRTSSRSASTPLPGPTATRGDSLAPTSPAVQIGGGDRDSGGPGVPTSTLVGVGVIAVLAGAGALRLRSSDRR